jgi:hypothetical protein
MQVMPNHHLIQWLPEARNGNCKDFFIQLNKRYALSLRVLEIGCSKVT